MNKLDLEKLRENPNRTLLMVATEIVKLFEDKISKNDVIMFKDKTARLILAYLSRYDGATQHELVKATQMKGSTVSVAITKNTPIAMAIIAQISSMTLLSAFFFS